MSIIKTGAAAGTVAAVVAGAFVLTSATATQAAPPNRNNTLTLVDANGVPVPDVVSVGSDGGFTRFIDGQLMNWSNRGEFSGPGRGLVAYKDAACTQPVLVNNDVWDDSAMPIWEPKLLMSGSVRDNSQPGWPATAIYVPVGDPQSGGLLYANRNANSWNAPPTCDPLIGSNQNGEHVPTPYYEAEQIPVPADVAGPISFR